MAIYTINLPASNEDVEKLEVGDTVYINGTVCTARDMAHLQMRELVENGKPLPELKKSKVAPSSMLALS